jgi:hypothetical protein
VSSVRNVDDVAQGGDGAAVNACGVVEAVGGP